QTQGHVITLPLQPLELIEGCQGGLAEQKSHGTSLVSLRDQHSMASEDHSLVFDLVPVDPGEDLGVEGCALAAVGRGSKEGTWTCLPFSVPLPKSINSIPVPSTGYSVTARGGRDRVSRSQFTVTTP
uniref:Uncharacterized protein n=1 Tax=Leptobrachium leishanense TaxID=445787 RepID=A0A8C5QC95_9ANUR